MENIRGPDTKEQAKKDYISGMKYKDIASKYNVSINTVKSWKQRYKWNRIKEKTKKNSAIRYKKMHVEQKNIKEVWKDIKGYEGLYQVSNYGRVKSLGNNKSKKEKELSLAKNNKGYLYTHLSKNNKRITIGVHRLVALAFIPNIDNLPEINHKDENKSNNKVYNLEWCTHKYNNLYGTRIERSIETRRNKKVDRG